MLAEGKRHREKTGQSLMVPRYDIVPIPEHLRGHLASNSIQMFTAETAQSMYDFRADDVIGKAAGRPILLLHSSVDSVTPTAVDRDVQARQPATRSAPVRRDRSLHVAESLLVRRDPTAERPSGNSARRRGVARMPEPRRVSVAAMLAFTRDALLAHGLRRRWSLRHSDRGRSDRLRRARHRGSATCNWIKSGQSIPS
jgi:hypothetical protein